MARGAYVGEGNPGRVGLDGGLLYIGYHIRTQPTDAYFKSGANRTDHRPGMGRAEPTTHAK